MGRLDSATSAGDRAPHQPQRRVPRPAGPQPRRAGGEDGHHAPEQLGGRHRGDGRRLRPGHGQGGRRVRRPSGAAPARPGLDVGRRRAADRQPSIRGTSGEASRTSAGRAPEACWPRSAAPGRNRWRSSPAMVADMSPADMEEMGTIYALAVVRAAEDGSQDRRARRRAERPRRPRGQRSAEWRRERRLAN